MNPETYEEVRQLFHELCELEAGEQRRRLAAASISTEVRAEVEGLLGFRPARDHFREEDLGSVGEGLLEDRLQEIHGLELPERIGEFEVVRKLGEGGMGVVYAVRSSPDGDELALKLIRPGLISSSLLGRFRRESELLRRLDHPGIATFHGAGESTVHFPSGPARLPYLLMELVEGRTLLDYARECALDDHQRLEIVARVADALQHAHARGVVHRDLKPGNVLVAPLLDDPLGRPTLLDFGVSQTTGEERSTLSRTLTGMLVGTLPYMSPEQVAGDGGRIDSRADVYSLGVIAFELLTGRLPHPVRGLPMLEAVRVIREDPPSRLGSWAPRLRGQVEVVIGRALEKHPGDRYPTAAAFASDLRAVLAGTDIEARPPSWHVQLRRYAGRNRALVAGVAAVFLALLVGLATTTWFALGQARAKALADQKTAVAESAAAHAQLGSARIAIERGDLVGARHSLERVAPARRGWEWDMLSSRLTTCLVVIPGHGDLLPGLHLALSEGGRRVWRTWLDETPETPLHHLQLLDVLSASVLEHRTWQDLDFLKIGEDGRSMLQMEPGNRVTLRRLSDGAILSELDLPSNEPPVVAFCRDADRALLLQPNRPAAWLGGKPASGVEPGLEARPPRDLAMSSDGGVALVGFGRFYDVLVGDRKTRRWVGSQFGREVDALAVSPDGRRAAVSISRVGIEVHRLKAGKLESQFVVQPDEPARWHAVAFDASGEVLAGGSSAGTVHLWSAETSLPIASFAGHSASLRDIRFSPDGEWLATLDRLGEVRLWRPEHASDWIMNVGSGELSPGPEDRFLWMPGGKRDIHIVDVVTGDLLGSLPLGPGITESIVHHPTRPIVACVTLARVKSEANLSLFDARSARLIRNLGEGRGLRGRVSLHFSPDGRWLAAQDVERGVFLWSTEDWELVSHREDALPGSARGSVRFHPGGDHLLVKGGDTQLCVLRLPDLVEERRLVASGNDVLTAMRIHPSGHQVAAGSRDHQVHLWSFDRGEEIGLLRGHSGTIRSLDWSPDGTRLATGSQDKTVRLWNIELREEVLLLPDHGAPVSSVAFSAGGKTLYTAGNRARRWDTISLAERQRQGMVARDIESELAPALEGAEGLPFEELQERLLAAAGDSEVRRHVAESLALRSALARPR